MIISLGVTVFIRSIRSGWRVAINRNCDLPKAKKETQQPSGGRVTHQYPKSAMFSKCTICPGSQ